ncbi:MAG: hypothetical protein QM756_06535 [Polyangiaceae bacterium]
MSVETLGRRRLRWLSLAAALFFAVHCGRFAFDGELERTLWLSNVATLTLVLGCAARSRHLTALAFAWLSFCAVLWFVDVGFGEMAVDSSALTHLGSFALAVMAVAVLGMPKNTWALAALGLALLVLLSRLATKPEHNINLAFGIANGWRGSFAEHLPYLLLLFSLGAALFFVAERAARALLQRRRPQPPER